MTDESKDEPMEELTGRCPVRLEYNEGEELGYYNHVAINSQNAGRMVSNVPNHYLQQDDPFYSRYVENCVRPEQWYECYPFQYLDDAARRGQVDLALDCRVLTEAKRKYAYMQFRQIYPAPMERFSFTDAFDLFFEDDEAGDLEHNDRVRLQERRQAARNPFMYCERWQEDLNLTATKQGLGNEQCVAPLTLYQMACMAYNPYHVKSGYETCFKFLMSDNVVPRPTLILHAVPNPLWVAKYGDLKILNPYKYRVAYQDQHPIKEETLGSVYVIRLEPANSHRPYPVHMTSVPEQRYHINDLGYWEMLYYKQPLSGGIVASDNDIFVSDSIDDRETEELYQRKKAVTKMGSLAKELESMKTEVHIERQWFHDVELPERVWAAIPPYSPFYFDERHGITPAIPAPGGFWNLKKRPWFDNPTWKEYMKYRTATVEEWRALQKATITSYILKDVPHTPVYGLLNQSKEFIDNESPYDGKHDDDPY